MVTRVDGQLVDSMAAPGRYRRDDAPGSQVSNLHAAVAVSRPDLVGTDDVHSVRPTPVIGAIAGETADATEIAQCGDIDQVDPGIRAVGQRIHAVTDIADIEAFQGLVGKINSGHPMQRGRGRGGECASAAQGDDGDKGDDSGELHGGFWHRGSSTR